MTDTPEIKKLRRELARAEASSTKASEARYRLPAGSPRARVTTANARWMRAAEHRDRVLAQLQALDRGESLADRGQLATDRGESPISPLSDGSERTMMKTARDHAEKALNWMDIHGRDASDNDMRVLTMAFHDAMADARRATIEECAKVAETEDTSLGSSLIAEKLRALLDTAACACTITRHERQENRACPVHFPEAGT